MELNKFLEILEKALPTDSAMSGDKVGAQVIVSDNADNILITLDLTDDLISEAKEIGVDTIVAFHPLIYRPLAEINQTERVARLTTKLIKNNINFVSVHTTFDTHSRGTNSILAEKLNLITDNFLIPLKDYSDKGIGLITHLEEPVELSDFLAICNRVFISPIRFATGKQGIVKKVAIIAGSGSSFIEDAVKSGADTFITADMTYHFFHAYKGIINLIDPGHYEMEQFVIEGIYKLLKESSDENNFTLFKTKIRSNPVNYYPDKAKYENLQIQFIN